MFQLVPLIKNLLGKFYIVHDSYKDEEGRGLVQRYCEMLADDWDTHFLPKVESLQDSTINPDLVDPRFINYLEEALGGIVKISNDLKLRRKLIRYASLLYQVKGTKLSYEILFKLLGFITVEIIEYPEGGGFDTWYDAEGSFDIDTFDTSCPTCSGYSLVLTGEVEKTPDFIRSIYNIIAFCQPINADLVGVTYNDEDIFDEVIHAYVDANGDLQFDNSSSLGTFMYINAQGDLMVTGDYSENYSIDENGDLIFTK